MTNALAHLAEPVLSPVPVQSQRVYRPELDALRFFAFFAVFLHHALNVQTGILMLRQPLIGRLLSAIQQVCGFGLALFFFLSAYLITSLLVIEKDRTGTVNLRKFYVRRVLRIWPLYFFFLAAAFCLGLVWTKYYVAPSRIAALMLLTGNWYSMLFGMGSLTIFQLWSISVEEQFYLVWPSIARGLSKYRLALLCMVICVGSSITVGVLIWTGSTTQSVWCNSLVESLFFAAGGLMALRTGLRKQRPSLGRASLAIFAGFLVWLAAQTIGGLTNHTASPNSLKVAAAYPLVALGCALILWGFLRLPAYLLPRWIVYLGRISYGLYVFHGLALVIVRELVASRLPPGGLSMIAEFGVTTAMAAISYRFLEKPFLKLKSRFELVHTRVA